MGVNDSAEVNDERASSFTRRTFVGSVIAGSVASSAQLSEGQSSDQIKLVECTFNINEQTQRLSIDPRVSLLDLLRERLQLTGTKKGCDHGQCGSCTVLVNGRRINSCLSLAVVHEGDQITTIEGLGKPDNLHPMQAAFIEHDGFQCGYCTPGQICSAVSMLDEFKSGAPSAVTKNLSPSVHLELTDEEIAERMSGNICRCAAYPNIVAAVRAVEARGRA